MEKDLNYSRRRNLPPVDADIGSINSFQWLLNAIKQLFKEHGPVRVVVGRHYNVNRPVGSHISTITGTGKFYLNNLEKTEYS